MTSTFKFKLMTGVAAAAVTVMAAGTASATDGYFSNGYGNAAKGMAGAGSVLALDTQAAMNNPAAMQALGNRVDVGLSVFSPRRDANVESTTGFFAGTTGGKYKSKSEYFYIPSVGVNVDKGEYSLGFTVSANGGMNTDYKDTVFAGGSSGATGVDLAQVFLGATYSRKVNKDHSFGITPTLAIQRFAATGLQGFGGISSARANLTDRGYDTSVGGGVRLGWLTELSNDVTVGATYQSRMYMSKFKKYSGLFAEQGDFDIPAALTVAMAVKATDKLTVALDVKNIYYGSVKAISNTNNVGAGTAGTLLGNDGGMGFGWDDMQVYKIGAQYEVDSALTLRAGWSHNTAAFKSTENIFNILAPAVVTDHVSAGATYKISDAHEIGGSLTRAFSTKISGDGNVNHGTNSLDLRMDQFDLDVGYTYNF